jgi:hypothetical protein
MKNLSVLTAVICGLFLLSSVPAMAHEDHKDAKTQKKTEKKATEKGEKKTEKKSAAMPMPNMHAMHQMMLETHAIMLETIKLVEKTAMDDDTAQKAEGLKRRMEDLIFMHKSMHDEMMKNMKEGMNEMDHDGHMGHMQHMNEMGNMEHMGHMGHMEHGDDSGGTESKEGKEKKDKTNPGGHSEEY